MTFTIDKRLLLYLVLAFIFATIIGTISHEYGHWIAAKIMRFNAHVSYGMTWLTDETPAMNYKQYFWFVLAGPLQTMLAGTIGLLLLFNTDKPISRISTRQWSLIFLSLFWLRQSANFAVWLSGLFIGASLEEQADEIKLSRYLNWPDWSIILVTGMTGIVVLTFVIFTFIPRSLRLTFILSGCIGGISGYLFWLVYFGKLIMP